MSGEDEKSPPSPSDESEAAQSLPDGAAFEYAAEEPTAMWNDQMLKAEGVLDASHHEETSQKSAPVQIHMETSKGPKRSSGPSWALVIAAATAVGAVVYFLVRSLRAG